MVCCKNRKIRLPFICLPFDVLRLLSTRRKIFHTMPQRGHNDIELDGQPYLAMLKALDGFIQKVAAARDEDQDGANESKDQAEGKAESPTTSSLSSKKGRGGKSKAGKGAKLESTHEQRVDTTTCSHL